MKIFISGASGNVGTALIRATQILDGFELVGGWCKEAGQDLGALAGIKPLGIIATDDLRSGLEIAEPDIIIDFSATTVLPDNLEIYAEMNLNAIVGTTGLTDDQLEPFRKIVKDKGLRWAVVPNYGLGFSFIQDFIKMVREYYPYVSIIDRHWPQMANAPSGTAVSLARTALGANGPVSSKEIYPGVLGGKIADVQVISQRLPWPGPYSEHEVILGRQDEIIRITLEDHTSNIYMDGVFLTAKKLPNMPAGSFIRELSEIR